jgi:hypothetical protein
MGLCPQRLWIYQNHRHRATVEKGRPDKLPQVNCLRFRMLPVYRSRHSPLAQKVKINGTSHANPIPPQPSPPRPGPAPVAAVPVNSSPPANLAAPPAIAPSPILPPTSAPPPLLRLQIHLRFRSQHCHLFLLLLALVLSPRRYLLLQLPPHHRQLNHPRPQVPLLTELRRLLL